MFLKTKRFVALLVNIGSSNLDELHIPNTLYSI